MAENTRPPVDEMPPSPVVAPGGDDENLTEQQRAALAYFREYAVDLEERRRMPVARAGVRLGIDAPGAPAPPASAAPAPMAISESDIPLPRAWVSALGGSGTLYGAVRDIFASGTEPVITKPVTVRAASLTADANGNKMLYEGTTLEKRSASTLYQPRTGAGVITGVVMGRYNLRDGDADVAMVIGGRLRREKLIDDGRLGYPLASSTEETALRALGVYLHDWTP